jgi:hypothetical protein
MTFASQTIPTTATPGINSFTPEVQSPAFSGVTQETLTVTTLGTAATTVTASQMLGGLLLQPAGAAINTTLDTAVNVFKALQNQVVGASFAFTLRNTATTANTITVVAGSGGTMTGTATIAQNAQRAFRLVITAVGDASGAGATYTVYTAGTGTF